MPTIYRLSLDFKSRKEMLLWFYTHGHSIIDDIDNIGIREEDDLDHSTVIRRVKRFLIRRKSDIARGYDITEQEG